MEKVRIGYMPLSKLSFDTGWAKEISRETIQELKKNEKAEIIPANIVFSDIEALKEVKSLKSKNIDLLLIHFCTFCLGTIIPAIFNEISIPVIILALPDPEFDGTRIRSNAFCALNMNSHTLHKMGIKYRAYFGPPGDIKLKNEIEKTILAIHALKNINNKRIGLVGSRAPGFYTSNYDELKLRKELGIEVEHIDISKIYKNSEKTSDKEISEEINYLNKNIGCNNNVSEEDTKKLLKAYIAFKKIALDFRLDSFAIKCWPEFHEDYGIAICPALGMLNSNGLTTSCEGDIYGAVTMMIQKNITSEIPFFSDFIYINEQENSGIFWHCGSAPWELAKNKYEVEYSNYPKIQKDLPVNGCTFDFQINSEDRRISVSRLGTDLNGDFRLLNIAGTGMNVGKILRGNSCKIRFNEPVGIIKQTILENGFEHHYSVIFGDTGNILEEIAFWKDMDIYLC